MLDRAYKLRQVTHAASILTVLIVLYQPIGLFLSSADEAYGPITTVRRDGRITK